MNIKFSAVADNDSTNAVCLWGRITAHRSAHMHSVTTDKRSVSVGRLRVESQPTAVHASTQWRTILRGRQGSNAHS